MTVEWLNKTEQRRMECDRDADFKVTQGRSYRSGRSGNVRARKLIFCTTVFEALNHEQSNQPMSLSLEDVLLVGLIFSTKLG